MKTGVVSFVVKTVFALVWILFITLGYESSAIAQAGVPQAPGYQQIRSGLISPQEANNILEPKTAARLLTAQAAVPIEPEVTELARGLRHNVDLIYQHIHDHYRYELAYGQRRGVVGTIVDQAGNSFDQSNVMVALLRASGYTANLIHGVIRLDPAQARNYLGSDDPNVLGVLLGSAGVPATITVYQGGTLAYLDKEHVWVKVNIDGANYVFDPAFKAHTIVQPIDLSAAMGYNQAAVTAAAMTGATESGDYVQNLNRQNVQAQLEQYATNLVNYIRTNNPAARMEDIVGGKIIEPTSANIRQAALPYQQSVIQEWAEIPSQYAPTLRVQYLGIDQTLSADQIYGKRLTISYNGNVPELKLDGVLLQAGTSTSLNVNSTVLIAINQPYAAGGGAYGDSSGSQNVVTGGTYLLHNAFVVPSKNMLERHRKRLRQLRQAGVADNSEEVLGESMAVASFSWIGQKGRAQQLSDQVRGLQTLHHNSVGIAGFNGAPFVDLPFNLVTNISLSNDADEDAAAFFNNAGIGSSLESGIIEQIHNFSAASTVALLDMANGQGTRIYDASATNWPVIKPSLSSYNASTLANIEAYINAGFRVLLPEAGNQLVGSWQGVGYLTISASQNQIGHQISGGLKGGFGQPQSESDNAANSGLPNGQDGQNQKNAAVDGDPISMASGDYLLESTDMTVGSNPFPFGLGFQRSYTSGAALADGPLGLGWTHNYDISVRPESDGFQGLGEDSPIDAAAAIVALHAGSDILRGTKTLQKVLIATLIQDWFMDNLTRNIATVVQPGDSQVFVRLSDGSFNPPPSKSNTLILENDNTYLLRTKHGVELDFGSNDQLAEWRNPNGVTVAFAYGPDGLAGISDGFGHALTLTYVNGHIANVTDGNGRSIAYSYDPDGNLTGFTDAENHTTRYTYASPGKLQDVFKPSFPSTAFISNRYDSQGRVKEQYSATNQLWQYFYTGFRTEMEDPLGRTVTRYFNRYGRVLAQTDQLGHTTTNEYDGLERHIKSVFPEGNSRAFEYDSYHNITRITASPKQGSPLAPVVKQFSYHPVWNRPISSTDAMGRITTYSYDSATGNLLSVARPQVDGQIPVTSYVYNGIGQVLTSTDPTGKTNRAVYDAVTGDMLSIIEDDGGLNITSTFIFDAIGNRIGVTDANGHTTTFDYDNARRRTQSQSPAPFNLIAKRFFDPDGRIIRIEQETGDLTTPWQITETTYTVFGGVAEIVAPGGRSTFYDYDILDRVNQMTDPEGRIVRTVYDEVGRVLEEREVPDLGQPNIDRIRAAYTYSPNGKRTSLTDGNGNTTSFSYDGLDRPERTTYADGTYAEAIFDAAGNLITRKTRGGDFFSYSYDALDRLRTETEPFATVDISYGYDLTGRMISATDASGTIGYSYNSAGRLATVTRPDAKAVGYEYDPAGNRTRLTYPDGYYVDYRYDELNRVTHVKENGVSDLAIYQYDALSRQTTINYANGTSTTFTWKPDDNDLDAINHAFSSESVVFAHTFNNAGERTSQSVTDDRYQWQPVALKTDTYVTNDLNQYTSAGSMALLYDDNGNLIDDGNNTYVFDAKNRLVSASTLAHPAGISYEYDPFNRRIAKTVEANTTEFVHDGALEIAEYDRDSGGLLRRYVYGPGQLAPLAQVTPSSGGATDHKYLHTDALGSVISVSSDSGFVVERHGYGPFGELGSTTGIAFRYTGQRYDEETGLYYFRARYYDPKLGRFLSVDPLGTVDGPNLYAYVANDPVNFVDPYGLSRDYFSKSLNQLLLGNYTDDVTLLGTLAQIGTGILGVDLLGDLRDLSYDLSHYDGTAAWWGQTLLDGVGVIPVVGVVKYADEAAALGKGAKNGVLDGANFAQKTFGQNFSSAGKFAGQSVDDVAAALKSGSLNPSDVPIDYIVRNGNTLILNTRSSQALTQAGIPRSQWNAVNRTGDTAFEARLTGQLQRNNLTEAGISTVRQSGGGQ